MTASALCVSSLPSTIASTLTAAPARHAHRHRSPWMDKNEAAAYVKLKPRALLRLVRLGEIPAYRLMGTAKHPVYRFLKSDLDRWLKSKLKQD